MTINSESTIPRLASKYSGIPDRLSKEADEAKEKLYGNKTLPNSVERKQDSPRFPPNVSREQFDSAIKELEIALGDPNVEVNNKPLIDGWYMEHP